MAYDILQEDFDARVEKRLLDDVRSRIRERSWTDANVFSHGDLHSGNYAMVNGEIKVIDWEHAHFNSPYWDLYHIIDLSHPLFPKAVTPPIRERLLHHYMEQAASHGVSFDPAAFQTEYALFSAVFSLWMLRLIENDLRRGNAVWSAERLLAQAEESRDRFEQCLFTAI